MNAESDATFTMYPRLPIEHPRQDALGEVNGRGAIHVDHLEFAFEIGLAEESVRAEAGVVDQHLDSILLGRQRLAQVIACFRVGEVGAERHAFHLVRDPDAFGQVGEAIDSARDEHEVIAA